MPSLEPTQMLLVSCSEPNLSHWAHLGFSSSTIGKTELAKKISNKNLFGHVHCFTKHFDELSTNEKET